MRLRITSGRFSSSSHHNTVQLKADIRSWIKDWNTDPNHHLDQDRRRHPRTPRTTIDTNVRRKTSRRHLRLRANGELGPRRDLRHRRDEPFAHVEMLRHNTTAHNPPAPTNSEDPDIRPTLTSFERSPLPLDRVGHGLPLRAPADLRRCGQHPDISGAVGADPDQVYVDINESLKQGTAVGHARAPCLGCVKNTQFTRARASAQRPTRMPLLTTTRPCKL